jgi:hypothetical protein
MKKIFIIIASSIGMKILFETFKSGYILTETLGISINYYALVPVMMLFIARFIISLVPMFLGINMKR